MFRSRTNGIGTNYRPYVVGLSLLSAASLAITVWMLVDFLKEQSIVDDIIDELPRRSKGAAEFLAGELKWQFRLTILVVINVIATTIALILLSRAYRASQASLRDFQAIASDVLSSMDLGIITTDLSGTITSVNRRCTELLDIDGSCVGLPLENIESVPLKEYRDDWMAERSPNMIRDLTFNHAGTKRRLRAFCEILRDHDGNEVGNVLQMRDVTERVLIEQRMRRMERYMGLGTLAGGLHHEIKNPLAALSLHVQLLEEQFEADTHSDEQRQMLSVIRTELARIGVVLESFRNFASIDRLYSAPVDIASMLGQQVDLMRPQAQQQNVQIAFNRPAGSATIEADQSRLEQVFLNLIINALEAMADGGTLTITLEQDSDSLTVEFTDTGCGIPQNLTNKILDPYFTTKDCGTGLGLALCDKIIRQHQGTLEFQSSEDGTTFEVTLPNDPAAIGGTRCIDTPPGSEMVPG